MATKRKVEDEEIRFITEVPAGEFIRAVVAKTGREYLKMAEEFTKQLDKLL